MQADDKCSVGNTVNPQQTLIPAGMTNSGNGFSHIKTFEVSYKTVKMPRPQRTTRNQKKESIMSKNTSINSTIMDLDSKAMDNNHIKLVMWKAEVRDRIKDACRKFGDMQKEKLAMLELEFRNSLMAIPKNVLNAVVDMKSDAFRSLILGVKQDESEQVASPPSPAPRTTIRRRSRSASNVKYSTRASQRIHKVRSTSVDIYKTPKGRMRLSTIMSHKKYTVTKPRKAQDSGLHVKRIMKPDEEAISTCGSPLYVASCNLGAPHVNIPLPGGVVLNIEPKSPKGALEIPTLDPKTKSQIKLLCEQLKTLC